MAKRPTNPPEVWNSGWDLNNPPVEGAILTERGWELPLKGTDPAEGLTELIVAIGQPDATVAAGGADIVSVNWADEDLEQGDTVGVVIQFNEKVDVTAGATIDIVSSGAAGTVTLTAAEQLDTGSVLFEGTVPSETADLTIPAPLAITGTVAADDGGAVETTALAATIQGGQINIA